MERVCLCFCFLASFCFILFCCLCFCLSIFCCFCVSCFVVSCFFFMASFGLRIRLEVILVVIFEGILRFLIFASGFVKFCLKAAAQAGSFSTAF